MFFFGCEITTYFPNYQEKSMNIDKISAKWTAAFCNSLI